MDASMSDVDFDSYWDEEARNPNRNRIRIGRQYQAQVPPLLKAGESDGRRLEELETKTYNPHHNLSNAQLDQYFAIAKAIGLFVQAIDACQDGLSEEGASANNNDGGGGGGDLLEAHKTWQILDTASARKFLGDHSNSHGGSQHAINNTVAASSSTLLTSIAQTATGSATTTPAGVNNTNASVSSLSSTPEKHQSITTRHRLQQQKEQLNSLDGETSAISFAAIAPAPSPTTSVSSSSPLKQTSNARILNAMKALSSFIAWHHPAQRDTKRCKVTSAELNDPIDLRSNEKHDSKTLSKLLAGDWSSMDEKIFARALQACGKNFSAIKKDYLPWKSVRSIIEYYYINIDKQNENQAKKKTANAAKPIKHNFDKPNKSPMDDNNNSKRGKGSKDTSGAKSNETDQRQEASEQSGDKSETTGSDNDGANTASTQANDGVCNPDEMGANQLGANQLDNNTNYLNDLINNFLANNKGKNDVKSSKNLAGQKVNAVKAKPIKHQELNDKTGAGENGSLGSLNLYLHGNLVLKLNAQQQETGQKWVESPEIPSKKRPLVTTNGTPSLRRNHHHHLHHSHPQRVNKHFAAITEEAGVDIPKRIKIETSGGEDSSSDKDISPSLSTPNRHRASPEDGFSVGGGDSDDDDSITSNESSSLVASSPSSSSTSVTTASKKARVKVENLNGSTTFGALASPQHERDTKLSVAGELELKKKILEANLNLLLSNSLVSNMFEPPRAHSSLSCTSPPVVPSSIFMGLNPSHSPSSATTNNNNNNHNKQQQSSKTDAPSLNGSNGVRTPATLGDIDHNGNASLAVPVDLTRKNGLANGALLSPRSRTSPSLSHHSPKTSHHTDRVSSSSSAALFSLPAPPTSKSGSGFSPASLGKHSSKKSSSSSFIRATASLAAAASQFHK